MIGVPKIGLAMEMPPSCLYCPCSLNALPYGKKYKAICQAAIFGKHVKKWIPRGTRPIDCPLIDLSRYEDDLR